MGQIFVQKLHKPYKKYMFTVSSEKLEEALDIWAHFFIDPLIGESAVGREMCAVNSEFEMASKHDGTRMNQIRKGEDYYY